MARSRHLGSYSVLSILDRVVAVIDDVIESVRNTSIEEQSHGLLLRSTEAQRQIDHLLGPELHQEIISSLSVMLSLLRRLSNSSTRPYQVATVHEGIYIVGSCMYMYLYYYHVDCSYSEVYGIS